MAGKFWKRVRKARRVKYAKRTILHEDIFAQRHFSNTLLLVLYQISLVLSNT